MRQGSLQRGGSILKKGATEGMEGRVRERGWGSRLFHNLCVCVCVCVYVCFYLSLSLTHTHAHTHTHTHTHTHALVPFCIFLKSGGTL